MLDAIGRSVTALRARIDALAASDRPGTVIVAIMTDGYENASVEWTYPAIKKLIEQQEQQHDWMFLYMGADQDAIEVGAKMGIARGQTLTFDRDTSGGAYEAMAASVSAYRAAPGAPPAERRAAAAFSEEQRRAARSAEKPGS